MKFESKNTTEENINFNNSIDVELTAINEDSIPLELKDRIQWILFKYEMIDGKLRKYPFNVQNQMKNWNLPENQSCFELVCRTLNNNHDYSGIGFVMTENDPYICIDFDHVYDPITKKWTQQAWEEIRKLNSYTEFSPSGTGVHVFVKGKMIKAGTRKKQPDGTDREMYFEKHYMTVTGNHVPETPLEINGTQEAIDELYDKWFSDKKELSPKRKTSVNDFKVFDMPNSLINNSSPSKCLSLTKNQVINFCKNAPSGFGEKFNKIFNGDISMYESKSHADMALAGMIAFHTYDYEMVKDIIQESALWDKKWERDDYCQRTIMTAIRNRWGR